VNRVDYRRAFWFPVPPAQLWETAGRFGLFEAWWEWLRDFEASPAEGLANGAVLRGTIVPPVPWRLRLEVRLRRCLPAHLIEADVTGDVRGQAELAMHEAAEGTRVAVTWSLEMRSLSLRTAARMAYPLVCWGHDRVVGMAVAGFQQRVLHGAGTVDAQGPADRPFLLPPGPCDDRVTGA
jgi:hypothetical protein